MEESTGAHTFDGCAVCITYTPLSDEVDPFACPWIRDCSWTALETIPPLAGLDPFSHAANLQDKFKDEPVCILVPGRLFDRCGTRKGRGGGWYDRFLSAVPRSWLRVGVCDSSQISNVPIEKKSHDEPMDVLLIRSAVGWRLIKIEEPGSE